MKFVQQDIRGSTRCVTSISGNVLARMDYQAFGEQIPSNIGQRTAIGFASSDSVRHRYARTESDTATGLNDTWWRKLENRSGRWNDIDYSQGLVGGLSRLRGLILCLTHGLKAVAIRHAGNLLSAAKAASGG